MLCVPEQKKTLYFSVILLAAFKALSPPSQNSKKQPNLCCFDTFFLLCSYWKMKRVHYEVDSETDTDEEIPAQIPRTGNSAFKKAGFEPLYVSVLLWHCGIILQQLCFLLPLEFITRAWTHLIHQWLYYVISDDLPAQRPLQMIAQINNAISLASELLVSAEDMTRRAALMRPPCPVVETNWANWSMPLPDGPAVENAEIFTQDHTANDCVS
jgi:hypothetical protein